MPKIKVIRGDIDLRGYNVVRTQFFTNANMISVTFSPNGIRFSSACVKKFEGTEYIELLVHPADCLCVARPCLEEYKYSMRWSKTSNNKFYPRIISGAAFLETLYELFDWIPSKKYRVRGEIMQLGDEHVALFDMRESEIIILNEVILPPQWQDSFGINYYEHKSERLPSVLISNKFATYDDKADLKPTAQNIVRENLRQLLKNMQDGGN